MRLLRWFLILACGLAIAAIGGHIYLARQVETQLERLATNLAPVGRLQWQGIWILPRGELRLSGIRFEPRGFRDPWVADAIVFRGDDLRHLVEAILLLERGGVPDRLTISLSGSRLPIGRPYTDWLDGNLLLSLPHAGAGCDFDERRLRDLNRFDLWELGLDGQLDYRQVVEDQQALIDIRGRLVVGPLLDWHVELLIALENPIVRLNQVPNTLAAGQLLDADIGFFNLGYHERLASYCQTGIDQHLAAWHQAWASQGITVDEVAEAAYRAFVDEPGSLKLALHGESPLQLHPLDSAALISWLANQRLSIRINDSAPVPVGFAAIETTLDPPPVISPQPQTDPISEDQSRRAEATPPPEQREPMPTGWHSTSLDTAADFLGQSVRLILTDESRASGVLVDLDDDALVLEIRSRFGVLTRPFPYDRIDQFWVRDAQRQQPF